MEYYFGKLMDLVNELAVLDTFVHILLPLWPAVLFGVVIGWCWKPRWAAYVIIGIRARLRCAWTFPSLLQPQRPSWLPVTTFSAVAKRLSSIFILRRRRNSAASTSPPSSDSTAFEIRMVDRAMREEDGIVNMNDLRHFLHLLNGNGEQITWKCVMEHSTSNMAYQAWRHEPETGPMICRSRTVFEDATPELVRDFFWDDEFRPRWDPMLAYFKLVEECSRTGTTIVHWIKKFPLFCGDREYIIGRRVWEAGQTFYCVTKGVPYPDLVKRDDPRRVDKYFSSWVIRPVQSCKSYGETACEVFLMHYEDIGIPKDVMKLGIRLKMWGSVKKLHDGFRVYQVARQSEGPVSRSAFLPRTITRISLAENSASSETAIEQSGVDVERRRMDWKWVVIAGTVVVAGLHKGAIINGLLFGAAHFRRKGQASQR